MNKKIAEAFSQNKAFIPFITCGDPDLETTAALIPALQKAGADLIELGIPFSDPTAEGPVIQQANVRALSNQITTDDILNMVSSLKGQIEVPLVFMTYANVVYSYGIDRFMKNAYEAGISGLILPDVPFEEKEEFAGPARDAGIEFISMIAPTSEDRIEKIAKEAEGFLYCVSSLGVTGTRQNITTDISSMIDLVRKSSDIPCAVGFGISTPEQAADMAGRSDGAITESAIVRLIGQHGKDCIEPVTDFVSSMKQAVLQAA